MEKLKETLWGLVGVAFLALVGIIMFGGACAMMAD